ncbi:MAG: CotH kinase family protein [Candidatus Hydrogenedentes bacterium]|nr:CotH kinase family protein [Candidatus Hydrogenedentota bacterium]
MFGTKCPLVALCVLSFGLLHGCAMEPMSQQVSVINLTGDTLFHVAAGATPVAAQAGENVLSEPIAPGAYRALSLPRTGRFYFHGVLGEGESRVERTSDMLLVRKGANGWLWWEEEGKVRDSIASEDLLSRTDLPAFVIDTEGREIPDDPRIPARALLQEARMPSGAAGTGPYAYDGHIGIERRGSFSQLAPKKQWRFETTDADGEDEEVEWLGLPEDEDWILQGVYVDKSLMRNPLVYTLSRDMGHYAARTRYCDVYLNDRGATGPISETYEGLYMLMETLKRGSDRVPVQRLEGDDTGLPAITGGYILQVRTFDQLDEGDNWFLAGGQFYVIEYPDADDITLEQQRYIIDYIRSFDLALFRSGFGDPETGYAAHIHVDAMIDYMLVQEWTKNTDAFKTSAYMYKRREEPITVGPQWDFDLAFGNISFGGYESPRGFILPALSGRAWPPRLLEDPAFAARYVARWQELRNGVLADEYVDSVIDALVADMKTGPARNFLRWNILGANIFVTHTRPQPATHAGEVAQLRAWIRDRAAWMDAHIDDLRPPAP